jgi:hypothetical protein
MLETQQRSSRFISIMWLVIGITAGVSIDRLFHREPPPTKPVTPNPVTAIAASNSANVEITNAIPGPDVLPPLEKLRRLGRVRSAFDLRACLDTINELPAKDCLAAMDAFRGLPDEDLKVLQRAILRRWATLDAQGMFQAAWPPRNAHWAMLVEAVANEWVTRDPEAALAQHSKMTDAMERIVFGRFIVLGVAATDPARAASYLSHEWGGLAADKDLFQMIASGWAYENPTAALAWASALPNGDGRSAALTSVFQAWSEKDPAAAAASIAQEPPGRIDARVFSTLSKSWSRTDPRAALAWIEGLTRKSDQDAAWSAFTPDVAKVGADASLEMINGIPSEANRVRVASQAAYAFAQQDPSAALAWVERLPEGTVRDSALKPVLETLSRTDPVKAVSFVTTLPPGDRRAELLSRAVRNWAGQDTDAAVAWARQLAEGPERDRLAAYVGRESTEYDPNRALLWLDLIQDSGTRHEFIGGLTESWARIDGPGAAQWLAKLPDASAETKGHYSIGRQWAFTDSDATARWMQSLPAGAAKDEAIRGFVSTIDGSDPGLGTKWAVTIENAQARLSTTRDVFGRWLQRDAAAARAWLDAQADLSSDLRAALARDAQPQPRR